MGLSAWDDSAMTQNVATVDAVGGKATIVDFKGTDVRSRKAARLIGVILPVSGQTWFYKLMGDEEVVEREREAFIKFVSTAKHPNG